MINLYACYYQLLSTFATLSLTNGFFWLMVCHRPQTKFVFTGVFLSTGGMHGGGRVWWYIFAWWAACMVVGCVWQVGMHGGGCAWQGACMARGVCGRKACMAGACAWQGVVHGQGVHGRRVCMAVGGTHPAGIHSCCCGLV